MGFADNWARLKEFVKFYIALIIMIGLYILVLISVAIRAKFDASLMTAVATFTLVTVTSIYTVLYHQILGEMQKSREIQYRTET